MAGGTSNLSVYSIPYSGELKDGLVVLLCTFDIYDPYCFGAVYHNNNWEYLPCNNTNIFLASIELKNGNIRIKAYTPDDNTYISVFQTENFPTE